MCPMCMTAIVATLGGFGSAGSITAFVATKLRLSNRKKDPPKTDRSTLPVERHPNQTTSERIAI
jgi:hypothetical protein